MIVDFLRYKGKLHDLDKQVNFFKIICLFLIFISASRTATISILVFILLVSFLKYKKFRVQIFIFSIICILFFSNISVIEIISFFSARDLFRAETLVTLSGRTEVWEVAWAEIIKAPFFGNGLQYDQLYIKQYSDRYIGEFKARHWSGIWNSYLSLLLNVGVFGLLSYLYALFILFFKSIYKTHAFIFFFVALISAFTESWMSSSMNTYTPLILLYFSLQITKSDESKK